MREATLPLRPRVLQVLRYDAVGGTEFMVASLLARQEGTRLSIELVTLDVRGPVAERMFAAGVRVRSLGGRGVVVAAVRLARILAREDFDIVNAYGFKTTMLVRLFVRLLARQTRFVSGVRGLHVTELEHLDGPKSRVVLLLERIASPLVDVYDANSLGAVELLAAQGIPRAKLHYIPNGIDATLWPAPSSRPPSPQPIIVCVARFVPRKRHSDLLAAAALLARAGVEFRLKLAGDGPGLHTRRESAERYGIGVHVEFCGRVQGGALKDLLSSANIFCLPSLWEGMAGSIMEAMAMGLPVVGTAVNGIADLVLDGETGLLVPPESPAELARALRVLLESPALREQYGAAGRARVSDVFSLEEMLTSKRDLYLKLLDAG